MPDILWDNEPATWDDINMFWGFATLRDIDVDVLAPVLRYSVAQPRQRDAMKIDDVMSRDSITIEGTLQKQTLNVEQPRILRT